MGIMIRSGLNIPCLSARQAQQFGILQYIGRFNPVNGCNKKIKNKDKKYHEHRSQQDYLLNDRRE